MLLLLLLDAVLLLLLLLLPGIVKGLVEAVKTAQKEKVVRVGLLSLRNLLVAGDAIMASDMVDAGLAKVVASRTMQVCRGGVHIATVVLLLWCWGLSSCRLLLGGGSCGQQQADRLGKAVASCAMVGWCFCSQPWLAAGRKWLKKTRRSHL